MHIHLCNRTPMVAGPPVWPPAATRAGCFQAAAVQKHGCHFSWPHLLPLLSPPPPMTRFNQSCQAPSFTLRSSAASFRCSPRSTVSWRNAHGCQLPNRWSACLRWHGEDVPRTWQLHIQHPTSKLVIGPETHRCTASKSPTPAACICMHSGSGPACRPV